MDHVQKYEFDRQGYLVIPDMLTEEEVSSLAAAVDELEKYALASVAEPPYREASWGGRYHHEESRGYFARGSNQHGQTLMVEDFFNADPSFDLLVNHRPTMDAIESVIQGPIRINNSELRIRYPGNSTTAHMGGPTDNKYRYSFSHRGIDAMMVRVIYFLHDVDIANGAFSVVPGTHKSNYPSPYTESVDDEPGMIGLEVKAGQGVVFTENLRHGGFTNTSDRARKTLHVGYGPAWMMSQNIATLDEPQYVLPETLERYDDAQRSLFVIQSPGAS